MEPSNNLRQRGSGFSDMGWEYHLPADPQEVPAARHAAIQACREAGVSESDCSMLDLALGEALANAVSHGTPICETVKSVNLRLWRYNSRLIVEVSDNGPGFDPPVPPYPMPDDYTLTHGRGLPLMEQLTDAFLVSRGDTETGGAAVYLVKSLE